MQASHRQEIFSWLHDTDPSSLHHNAQKVYEPGTADWIFRTSEWKAWFNGDQRFLWIHGIPGAGKTVLISHVIEHANRLLDNERHFNKVQNSQEITPEGQSIVIYYYCYYGHSQDEAIPFLKWLIARLCRQRDCIPEFLQNLYTQHTEPNSSDYLRALEYSLEHYKVAYVFVDAVDESDQRHNLLRVLQDLAGDPRFQRI